MSYASALEKLRDLGMHGMVVSRDGETIAEAVIHPHRLDKPHTLNSLTKSFTSTAIGFAIQEGLLSLDDRAVSFYPDVLPSHPCENMEKITIRHLLHMATGHTKEPYYWPTEQTPLPSFLRSYVEAEPGSCFLYNTAGSHHLGYILEKVSGQSVEDFLRTRLLEPLGIKEWIWEKHPDGVCKTGVGLHLCTRDIVKFGNFLLFEGLYDGKQLISKEWLREATTAKIIQPGEPDSDWTSGYGYQFWINSREDSYRADGAFGQFCIVIPNRKLVVAMNSGTHDMGAMLDVIFEDLLPALDGEIPFSSELSVIPPSGHPDFPLKSYVLSKNRYCIEKIAFSGQNKVTVTVGGKESIFTYCQGEWSGTDQDTFCAAGTDGNDAVLRLLYVNTPFSDTLRMRFSCNGVIINHKRNLGFDNDLEHIIYGLEEED